MLEQRRDLRREKVSFARELRGQIYDKLETKLAVLYDTLFGFSEAQAISRIKEFEAKNVPSKSISYQ